ncbi:iron-containing alcohol dehydrogenase [Quadrisphaera sp. DSM 44207]|uniref:iron-containing alcohol dehydrogenase n=1 Tax=Quadrisphaera sp. DSM 44207 TaxID=1881057 RepID=UPI000889EFEC|nr:iron-containing alcohol dehydrogenase [Quadrisphaera sp. DSM 44207]SDQ83659.1 glycerol-1-phosphate dehydrogenase [NAD(P)+] [Quadrisphaera sp. DSM 44207]
MSPPPASGALAAVRDRLAAADPDGSLVPCGIAQLHIGADAVQRVGGVVEDLLAGGSSPGRRPDVLLLVDRTRIERAGADLKALVQDQLAQRAAVRREVLDDGHGELHVSEAVVQAATDAARGADAVVAVGGGTISDIAKLATARAGAAALVVVQTAASVDGYTDDVSVVLRDGVKRTVPSRWPDAVIADVEVIGGAPPGMNRAGFGEMTSMFTAPADWRLASLVGVDPTFHRGPIALLEEVGGELGTWSAGLRTAEPEAVEQLTRALAVRGIATGVAGTTAALSGVEHLVSHMLDLHHGERGEPIGLHGAQVGVAAVVAAAAWELLLERLAAGEHETPRTEAALARALDADAARRRVERAFAPLDPTGRIGGECWSDYAKKLAAVAQHREQLRGFLRSWRQHEGELRSLLRPSAQMGSALRAAGAAATFEELSPSVDADLARWAVQHCALMRDRFTAVDLLTLLGWWGDAEVDDVLERAARAVGPAAEVSGVGRGG